MRNTILCIGHPENPHILEVEKYVKLLDKEAKWVVFQPDFDGHFIEITAGNVSGFTSNCVFVVNGERIPAESITSVWDYLKPWNTLENQDLQGRRAVEFASSEWGRVFRSLVSYLPQARWLNPLPGSHLSNSKPYQLRLAQEVGLTVPSTTITNNPEAVKKIFDHGRIIFKTMSPLVQYPDSMVFTTEITKEFSSQSKKSIVQCPAIYQQLVERRSDLRITVVGREVFPVRIATQTLGEAKDRLDWRRQQDKDEIFSKAQISESLKERILEFHKRAGQVYGAFDFLECDDDVIFLECNSAGAWLWLEQAVGIKVSDAIARYLLGMDETDSPEK